MRALALVTVGLITITGCDKMKGKTGIVAGGATASVAPDSISFVVEGPVSGIVLVTTDKTGKPEGGQQWDTFNAGQNPPVLIRSSSMQPTRATSPKTTTSSCSSSGPITPS